MTNNTKTIPGTFYLLALLPIFLVGAIYAHVPEFGFAWDDMILMQTPAYSSLNPLHVLTRPANGLEYLPVRDLSLIVDHWLYGPWAGGYHITNVLAFVFACTMLLLFYRRIFDVADPAIAAQSTRLALWCTLLFAAHPLQVEPVAFVTCRNALLALCFTLASALAYDRHIATNKCWTYVASLVFLVLALLAKATAIFLPLFLTLLHLYIDKAASARSSIKKLIPHYLIAAGAVILHLWMARHTGAVTAPLTIAGVLFKLPNLIAIPVFYLSKFLWPLDLSIEYVPKDFFKASAILLAMSAFAVGVFGRILRYGSATRSLTWFLAWAFLIMLLPVMNLFPTVPMVADRYAQISLLALVALVAAPSLRSLSWIFQSLIVGVLVVGLAYLSYQRSLVWHDDITLFQATINSNPHAIKSMRNLGNALWRENREAEALAVFERADALSPGDFSYEFMLGWSAQKSGDFRAAQKHLEIATQKNAHATIYLAWLKLAEVYHQLGQYERARFALLRSIQLAGSTARDESNKKIAMKMLEDMKGR